jgi:hypothetical protein
LNDRARFVEAMVANLPERPAYFRRSVEFARVDLSETEAKERGIAYRLAKIPMLTVYRARTLFETRGFLKALIDTESDRIPGFTALGAEVGEIIAAVQVAMLAGLPYTALRDAIFTHPHHGRGTHPAVLGRARQVTKDRGGSAFSQLTCQELDTEQLIDLKAAGRYPARRDSAHSFEPEGARLDFPPNSNSPRVPPTLSLRFHCPTEPLSHASPGSQTLMSDISKPYATSWPTSVAEFWRSIAGNAQGSPKQGVASDSPWSLDIFL